MSIRNTPTRDAMNGKILPTLKKSTVIVACEDEWNVSWGALKEIRAGRSRPHSFSFLCIASNRHGEGAFCRAYTLPRQIKEGVRSSVFSVGGAIASPNTEHNVYRKHKLLEAI